MHRKALVKRRKEKLDVTFEGMTSTIEGVEAGLIYGSSDLFLAIKSKEGLWKFYNLRKREMWNPPSRVIRINPVRGTGCFAEGLLENGNRALYRLNDPKQIFVGQGTIEVLFSDFDQDVFVRTNTDSTCKSWKLDTNTSSPKTSIKNSNVFT